MKFHVRNIASRMKNANRFIVPKKIKCWMKNYRKNKSGKGDTKNNALKFYSTKRHLLLFCVHAPSCVTKHTNTQWQISEVFLFFLAEWNRPFSIHFVCIYFSRLFFYSLEVSNSISFVELFLMTLFDRFLRVVGIKTNGVSCVRHCGVSIVSSWGEQQKTWNVLKRNNTKLNDQRIKSKSKRIKYRIV